METEIRQNDRPVIANFDEPIEFIKAMLKYLRRVESGYSVLAATKNLRKVSPTLVSLVVQKKRPLTLDRVEEFSKLLRLTSSEKSYLSNWVDPKKMDLQFQTGNSKHLRSDRKEVTAHILNDWINVYVKDTFQIPAVQENPNLVFRELANIATPRRIEKAMKFLLIQGHLRKTLDGKIVTDTPLTVTDLSVPNQKVRQFHKGALGIAKVALDSHPASERYANTFIMPVSKEKYRELVSLVQDFAEKLKDFSAETTGDQLYQVIINVSPTGGKFE